MDDERPRGVPIKYRFNANDPHALQGLVMDEVIDLKVSLDALVSLVCGLYDDPQIAAKNYRDIREEVALRLAYDYENKINKKGKAASDHEGD